MFILKTMDGNKFKITEEEYRGIIAGDGLLVLRSCGVSINKSRIETIYPESMVAQIEKKTDRTKQLMGVTPEGEQVFKRFGQWYISKPNSPYHYDEEGNSTLKYDGNPLLPTPEEYESEYKYKASGTWASALIGASSEVDDRLMIDRSGRSTGGGFQRIQNTLST